MFALENSPYLLAHDSSQAGLKHEQLKPPCTNAFNLTLFVYRKSINDYTLLSMTKNKQHPRTGYRKPPKEPRPVCVAPAQPAKPPS